MEGNGEVPTPVEPQAAPEQKAAFTPITAQEIPAPPAPESGFLSRILSKIGMLKQPELPSEIPQPTAAPTGNAVETDALSGFSAQRTPEELQALAQTRSALEAESQAQNTPSQPVVETPTSPAVQRMQTGNGIGKVTG